MHQSRKYVEHKGGRAALLVVRACFVFVLPCLRLCLCCMSEVCGRRFAAAPPWHVKSVGRRISFPSSVSG